MMERRARTMSWEDPAPGAKAAQEMSGLECLRAMMRKDFPGPPIARLIGFGFVELEEGRVVFECEPTECDYNPVGSVHGRLACTLFDSAMGCAVHTELPAGVGYTTVELKVNLLRPITAANGRLLCEATRSTSEDASPPPRRASLTRRASSTATPLRRA
jgi:uncharacterized protein (TIGR00369 family)